jgi:hypothetical protein
MKTTFIVTSAVQTRFGIYSPEQRLDMTLETLKCLRERVPGCKIVISEVSGAGLVAKFEDALVDACDVYLDFTNNSEVRYIYDNRIWYDNWDIVKNLTELTTFPIALKTLLDAGEIDDQDRIFKMSGRYLLNEKFDLSFYEQPNIVDRIVIGKSVPSQFPFAVTGLDTQYMCRLLSWPRALHKPMIEYYEKGRDYMKHRMSLGGYADIEHCLYYAIPRDQVHEVDQVGVYGNIAPNGIPIIN